jgi:hypothetical protein
VWRAASMLRQAKARESFEHSGSERTHTTYGSADIGHIRCKSLPRSRSRCGGFCNLLPSTSL